MGIQFKQIDNLDATFSSMSGALQEQITSNTERSSGFISGDSVIGGWKYFTGNVDFSGAQGIQVGSNSIYTPNNLIAGGVKIGYPISTPRNSTPAPKGALQVSGGQSYFEGQVNIDNNAGIQISNGAITGGTGNLRFITGETLAYGAGNFTGSLTLSGVAVSTGAESKWADGVSAGDIYYSGGDVGIGTNNPAYALDVVGSVRLYNSSTPHYPKVEGTTNEVGINFQNSQSNWSIFLDDSAKDDLPYGGIGFYGGVSPSLKMSIDDSGNVGIGTDAPAAPLEIASTAGGVIMPRLTTTQMNAISSSTNGEMIYNTTANKFYGYANSSWVALH